MATATGSASPATNVFATAPGIRRREFVDRLATVVMCTCAGLAVLVLALILMHVVVNGMAALNLAFFTERPLPQGEAGGGVAPAIIGTLVMLGVGAVFGVPIGIGTAIYLAEYGRGSFARTVSFLIDLVAGLPSI